MKFLSQINVNTEYILPFVDGTNGQVLTTDGNGAVYWGSIAAGVTTLDGLTDVILTSPTSGQLLRYGIPPGSGEPQPVWYNFTPNYLTPSSSIDNLGDVTITSAASGQVLQWNGSAWVNATLSTVEYVSKVQHTVKAGVAITKGQAVYVTTSDGTNMIVGLASNTSEATSSKVIGLAASNASINDQIFVVTEGLLAGLNTSTATAGDPVWLGTNGNLIFGLLNKPASPAHLVYIGVVTRVQQNNGEIFVKVQNGIEIDEIHDVQISSPATGQLLRRDSDGYWKNWTPNFLVPSNVSGTTNYISKFTGANTVGNSQIFDNGTNVGIGTTAPGYKLDVSGTAYVSDDILVGATNATSWHRISVATGGFIAQDGGRGIGAYVDSTAAEFFAYNYSIGSYIPLVIRTSTLNIANNGGSSIIYHDGTNVGIGTTAPTAGYKLDVVGSILSQVASGNTSIVVSTNNANGAMNAIAGSGLEIATDSTNQNISFRTGASSRMYIKSDGNVGIGTTSPAYKLDVNVASNSDALRVQQAGASKFILNGDGVMTWGATAASGVLTWDTNIVYIGGLTNNALGIWAGGSEKVRITTGGNVGIGTTSPNAKLDVNGAANATSFSSTALFIANADTSGSLQPDQGSPANKIYSFRWQGGEQGYIDTDAKITFAGFKTPTGTASQFLKANGTVDSSVYITSAALSGYATQAWVNSNFYTQGQIDDFFGGAEPIIGYNKSNWDTAYNDKINSASFNTTNGILTLTQQDGGTVTVDLDGRYLTSDTDAQTLTWEAPTKNLSITNGNTVTLEGLATEDYVLSQGFISSESDTLATVTARGNISNTKIQIRTAGNVAGGNIQLGPYSDGASKWGFITSQHFNSSLEPEGFSVIGGLALNGVNAVVIGGNIYESNPATQIQFWTHSSDTHGLGGTQRGVIDSSGNWGVGTTNPQYRLDVAGGNVRLSQGYESVRIHGVDLLGYSSGNLWQIGNTTYSSLVLSTSWDWDRQVEFNYTPNTTGQVAGVLRIGQMQKNSATWTHGRTEFYVNGSVRSNINTYGVGIGREAASNEKFAIDLSDGVWGVHIYNAGTAIGGLHANSNVITLQSDGNRNIEIATGTGNANWNGNIIATRTWVQAQGYLTSETDSQTLDWDGASKNLSITNGNTVTLDGLATEEFVTSQGYLTSLPSHNHDDRYYTESESDSRFVNASGDTMNGSLSFDAAAVIKKRITGVGDNPVKTASGVLASRSDNGGGYTYYVIETNVPQDDYQMGGFTIELLGRYGETNHKTKIDLGGYWNAESNSGFIGFEAHGTNPQYKPTIEVARNSAGKTAFIIYGVSWSYPVIVARDLWLGYSQTDGGSYGEGWSITGTNDVSSYTNKDTVVWRNAYSDSNPAGYITGYTETDTLATVTARGASTSTTLNLNGRVNIGNGLARPNALTSDSVAHARIGGADVHLYVASLEAAGGYRVAVQAARTSDFASFGLDLQSNGGTLFYGGNEIATRTWVQAQGYLTSETDSQDLTWDPGSKTLGITNGNNVVLENLATEDYVTSQGYITGYTETDTLATVTGRGASTSSPITINGGGSQPLSLTTSSGSPWHLALVRSDLGLTSRVFAHNSPYNGWYFEHNISIAGNTNWHSGNDGSGSGLDADLLDGNHASAFATRQDGSRYTTNFNSILSSGFFNAEGQPANAPDDYGQLIVAKGIDTGLQIFGGYDSNNLWFRGWGYGPEADGFYPWRKIWHDGNDGSSSGLDADLLDGNHASAFYLATNPSGYITGSYLDDYTRGAYRVISDYNSNSTWYIRSNGQFVFGTGHDWTASFRLNIDNGSGYGSNGSWAYFGQQDSNATNGTWRGVRIRKFAGGSAVDGDLSAGAYYIGTTRKDTNWDAAYTWGNHADAPYWNVSLTDAVQVEAQEVIFAGNVTIQGTLTESSSIRFKENIAPLDPALDKVNQLEAVSYNKIGADDREIGLIAEDVAELFPEVVTYNDEGQPQGIQYQRLSVILLKAVQELTERVNKLENK